MAGFFGIDGNNKVSKWLQDLVGELGVGWTDVPRQSPASLGLPWQAFCESERPYQEVLKAAILCISQREEDFLLEKCYPEAPEYDGEAILQEDRRLDALRYRLVPGRLAEPVFWRRYFALVAQVRQDILGSVVTEHDDLVHVPQNPECSLAGVHDDEGPQSLQGSLLDMRGTSSMGDATHMLMSGEDDMHSNACFSPSAGPVSRRQAMSIEGGAATVDDASCDASSMAFSPPASIAPIRTHFEAPSRQESSSGAASLREGFDSRPRRREHRHQQHTAVAERPSGSAGGTATGGLPCSGLSQPPQPVLAVVAEGGSGSEASPADSPAGDAVVGNVTSAAEIPAEQRLVGGSLVQSLEALQRLCHSPDGQRLAHARVGQLGRQLGSREMEQKASAAVSSAAASCSVPAAVAPLQGQPACTVLLSASAAAVISLQEPSAICDVWLLVLEHLFVRAGNLELLYHMSQGAPGQDRVLALLHLLACCTCCLVAPMESARSSQPGQQPVPAPNSRHPQPPPVLQDGRLLHAAGSALRGSTADLWLQEQQRLWLLCEISAFKSAKKGCCMEDYISWSRSTGQAGRPGGALQLAVLSATEQERVWAAAPDMPAAQQPQCCDPAAAGGHALTALRGADYVELLIAMSCAMARMACWQASKVLQTAGMPPEEHASVSPLAALLALLNQPSCQLSAAHVTQLVQAVKDLRQYLQCSLPGSGAHQDRLPLDPVAPCTILGPSAAQLPAVQSAPPPRKAIAATAPTAANSWGALAPTASEDLSAEDWLVVAGGAW
ncbi:hypothetical protein WJX74_002045 [Apatococcus lobatus]|uniref:BSD domain-containing protein n=1 Tax=Apatococcus lobatus TaxID=904363 RepID=A0AAW1RSC1_9CHLO